jgi:hypothetical protein
LNDGTWLFTKIRDESTLAELLPDGELDTLRPFLKSQSKIVTGFEQGINLLNGYWPNLYARTVHSDFCELVWDYVAYENYENYGGRSILVMRKYNQRVSTTMIKLTDGENEYVMRQPTEIHFGSSANLLGSVIMTNPGSFKFSGSEDWTTLPDSKGRLQSAESNGSPDPTMISIIRVINEGFKQAGRGTPSGIVRVHNLSNIREPNAKLVKALHQKVTKILEKNHLDMNLLEDPATNSESGFVKMVKESQFLIMGFVRQVFESRIREIMNWKEKNPSCVYAYALDNIGCYSHPYRWMIHEELRSKAITMLKCGIEKY